MNNYFAALTLCGLVALSQPVMASETEIPSKLAMGEGQIFPSEEQNAALNEIAKSAENAARKNGLSETKSPLRGPVQIELRGVQIWIRIVGVISRAGAMAVVMQLFEKLEKTDIKKLIVRFVTNIDVVDVGNGHSKYIEKDVRFHMIMTCGYSPDE
jgi:hypothetical protein